MNNFKIKLFESFDNDLKNIWIDFEKDSYHFFFKNLNGKDCGLIKIKSIIKKSNAVL